MTIFTSPRNPVLYVAEIGGNHEGDWERARILNKLAIASGADVVKYQIYKGDTLVSRIESPDRNAHFKRFELSSEQYIKLAEEVIGAGLQFMASIWDEAMLSWVDPLVRIHKVGSGDLTCYPMIAALVRTRKPIILSTGLATMDEVADTVRFIERLDNSYINDRKLALLQCTSSYPCPDEDANLEAMVALRKRFRLPTGYSDHTVGSLAVEAAVALGAEIIEKHFTDSREGSTFRDHQVSLTCEEVRDLLPRLGRIRRFKGDGIKRPTKAEVDQAHTISFRRSIYARRDVPAGEMLTSADITFLRPAHGISASRYNDVIGRRLTRPLKQYELLHEEDLQ